MNHLEQRCKNLDAENLELKSLLEKVQRPQHRPLRHVLEDDQQQKYRQFADRSDALGLTIPSATTHTAITNQLSESSLNEHNRIRRPQQ